MAMASNYISNDRFPISSLNWGSAEKTSATVRVEREKILLPARPSHSHRINLTAFDSLLVMIHYNQRGLLYGMPAHGFGPAVTLLEKSLSQVLASFYPLAGRLATSPSDGAICIDCNDAGAAFFEASAESVTVADLLAADVPVTVDQLFALNGAINVEGHRLPLLAVQVTRLRDGIFVGCSLNHSVGDGASLWHFFNSWAEFCRGNDQHLPTINPNHDRFAIPSSPNRSSVPLNLDLDTDIGRFCPPPLRSKIFHFTKEMLNGLKERANIAREALLPVSSLQALCGHVWQAVTRARGLGRQNLTTFQLVVDCRSRLVPPLPSEYFGNAIQTVKVTSKVWEVESNEVSFPAQLLHDLIQSHDDMSIKLRNDEWEKNPTFITWETIEKTSTNLLHLGSSPRFKMYEADFGWGKPVAARSGSGNKVDGKLQIYPGREQAGSVDIEICLVPKTMNALEIDQHFVNPLQCCVGNDELFGD